MIDHQELGTLYTVNEAIEITGYTLNQLRNWRTPQRRDRAPFGYVQIGHNVFYKADDLADHLTATATQSYTYYPTKKDD